MPFGPVFNPSIGLSLLKAVVEQQGVSARVRYFSIDFAERVGQAFYSGIAGLGPPPLEDQAGEWIFAGDLFPSSRRAVTGYVNGILKRQNEPDAEGASPAVIKRILAARRHVRGFLADCTDEVLRENPRLVGFTSLFQQHVASLALARRIKRARPDITVVLGGANCEGAMGAETVRQFPFVDAAVSGEGENVFPELVRRVLEGRQLDDLPGVLTPPLAGNERAAEEPASTPRVEELDALPYPDYSDYFQQFEESRYGRTWQPSILFEASRGCWWGQKMHCTFCALNGGTMTYRSKSAPRALAEIIHLTERHPDCDVEVTDNILDLRYFDDLLPELARRRLGVEFCWETKANLRKEQVRMLAEAGVTFLQPGIESLSDTLLKLMKKGVTAPQNIQVLKWCREFGIHPYWNILWGSPGEPAEEYTRMARLVPSLTHLAPPLSLGEIRLSRFSPNFVEAARLGLVDVAPISSYRHVYPLPDRALANLASFFDCAGPDRRDVDESVDLLEKAVARWTRVSKRSDLFSVEVDGKLLLWDLRPAAREPLTILEGPDKRLYRACDRVRSLGDLARIVSGSKPGPRSLDRVETRLDGLLARRLVLKDGKRYLALAVPVGRNVPKPGAMGPFRKVLRQSGKRVRGGYVLPLNAGSPLATRRPGRDPRSRRQPRQRPDPPLSTSNFAFRPTGDLFVRIDGS
jgi:ribosomal peptide maturation radical SAM protein 1